MSVCHALSHPVDLLRLQRLKPHRYPYLLQTVARTDTQPHFDILFACPLYAILLNDDARIEIDPTLLDDCWKRPKIDIDIPSIPPGGDFLSVLNGVFNTDNRVHAHQSLNVPAFTGGYFIYLGYELLAQIEPTVVIPTRKHNTQTLPRAFLTRIPLAIVHEHQSNTSFLMCEPGFETGIDVVREDIDAMANAAASTVVSTTFVDYAQSPVVEENPRIYLDNIAKVQGYIREGDVFQVNLSRQWQSQLPSAGNAQDIYARLCNTNPAPFAACVHYKEAYIVSSSPERLLSVRDRTIQTRPIAGTRPRAANTENDLLLKQELIAHPKERAEHIMLIDLERNDLGRVCEVGSVRVDELMVLESYAHVHHIVSNISGRLRAEVLPGDVIRALFPGGTITGCPKVRCMQIIAELEQQQRGAYTGSLGYINHNGDMELNILIRTLQIYGNTLAFRAGGGIVADSVALHELEETRAKAKGLIMAISGE